MEQWGIPRRSMENWEPWILPAEFERKSAHCCYHEDGSQMEWISTIDIRERCESHVSSCRLMLVAWPDRVGDTSAVTVIHSSISVKNW
ncbi:hypothetical protein PROFUN_03380 [Planoprotostelium fungivorum]|uniref:Uncharacterized protein n=1 Tax=Planoprotostelium fungivorum TaxID=1890364 RepID=A0A2P6NWD9_9EUKA|nr:hypothetical protein PROFUN_03380 [Planoprotostelium fungivorum]